MYGDVVTVGSLYETAVGLHGCKNGFNGVMDPRKINQAFEITVASLTQNVPKPEKKP